MCTHPLNNMYTFFLRSMLSYFSATSSSQGRWFSPVWCAKCLHFYLMNVFAWSFKLCVGYVCTPVRQSLLNETFNVRVICFVMLIAEIHQCVITQTNYLSYVPRQPATI